MEVAGGDEYESPTSILTHGNVRIRHHGDSKSASPALHRAADTASYPFGTKHHLNETNKSGSSKRALTKLSDLGRLFYNIKRQKVVVIGKSLSLRN